MPTSKKTVANAQAFEKLEQVANRIANAMTTRTELLRTLIDPRRDLDKECGYPADVDLDQYQRMYDREGIASRVVEIMPEECWQIDPDVYEQEGAESTEFERAWDQLVKRFNLFHFLERVDKLSGIGRFGVLLIGIDDGLEMDKPIPGVDDQLELNFQDENELNQSGSTDTPDNQPTADQTALDTERKILYLRTFHERLIQIISTERDITSPRFGLPTMYSIQLADPSTETIGGSLISSPIEGTAISAIKVHWSRILHLADGRVSSEVYGTPRQQRVFNRLCDLTKILGGSAEMFFRGAFPGFSFEVDPDVTGAILDLDSIRDEFEKYANSLQRYLAMEGVRVNQLAPQVADPTPHFDNEIKSICISMGVPWRIFVGSEQAQLASAQDKKTWNGRVGRRQNKYITPMIIIPLIKRMIQIGILPMPANLIVKWPDLNSPTELDRADVAAKTTEAIGKYVTTGADALIPPQAFLTEIMGFDSNKAAKILAEADSPEAEALRERLTPPAMPGADPNGSSNVPATRPVSDGTATKTAQKGSQRASSVA